jgi:pectinesterase
MKVRRLATVVAAVLCAVGRSSGQQPSEGADAARNAFSIPATVRVVPDLVYAQYGARKLRLDLYLPPESSRSGAIPGVIVVRGGGWRSGDKEAFGFIAGQLAKEGFAAASIEYRTSAEARFPAAVHDVKAAVRWMRAQASAYGVNPLAIGAVGGSAGGHLVAMLATSAGIKDLEGAGGHAAASSQVQAVVAMACVCSMDMKGAAVTEFIGAPLEAHAAEMRAASPTTYVSGRSAPLLLIHSRTDPVVPFSQSVEIEGLYRRAGASVVLKHVAAPNTHAFWNETRYFPETMSQAVEFLRANLRALR